MPQYARLLLHCANLGGGAAVESDDDDGVVDVNAAPSHFHTLSLSCFCWRSRLYEKGIKTPPPQLFFSGNRVCCYKRGLERAPRTVNSNAASICSSVCARDIAAYRRFSITFFFYSAAPLLLSVLPDSRPFIYMRRTHSHLDGARTRSLCHTLALSFG